MTPTRTHFCSVRPIRAGLVGVYIVAVSLLVGCAPTSSTRSTPPPPPQLLSSAELEIPGDCARPPGAIFRTGFVVQPDGRVLEAVSESGDGCVQQALREWVSSFRYTAVSNAIPMVIDWMEVTATRG